VWKGNVGTTRRTLSLGQITEGCRTGGVNAEILYVTRSRSANCRSPKISAKGNKPEHAEEIGHVIHEAFTVFRVGTLYRR